MDSLIAEAEDVYTIKAELLEKARKEMAVELAKPDLKPVLTQFFGFMGFLSKDMGRPDIAEALMKAMEPEFAPHSHRFKDILDANNAKKMDSARQKFANMMGPSQKNEPVIEPKEKIDFKLPKSNVKG